MIVIDENNVAVLSGILGMNAQKCWGENWFAPMWNTSNAYLVDLPEPDNFKPSQFTLVNGTLVPTEEYAVILADLQNEANRAAAKLVREDTVSRIKVTTSSGKVFDGDETSQGRMARAIIALQATETPSVTWVLADNTPTTVSAMELVEALALAGAAQANVWVLT